MSDKVQLVADEVKDAKHQVEGVIIRRPWRAVLGLVVVFAVGVIVGAVAF